MDTRKFSPVLRSRQLLVVTNVAKPFTVVGMPLRGYIRRIMVKEGTKAAATVTLSFQDSRNATVGPFLVYTTGAYDANGVFDSFEAENSEGIYYELADPTDGRKVGTMNLTALNDVAGPLTVELSIEVLPLVETQLASS